MRSYVLTRVVMNRDGLGNLSHGARRGNGLIPDSSRAQRNLGEWSSVVLTLLETSAESRTEFILTLLKPIQSNGRQRDIIVTASFCNFGGLTPCRLAPRCGGT